MVKNSQEKKIQQFVATHSNRKKSASDILIPGLLLLHHLDLVMYYTRVYLFTGLDYWTDL